MVLEFRTQVGSDVARGRAGIMGWWCSSFSLQLGTLPTAASAYCLPTLVLLSEPSVAQSSPASVIAVGACLWGTRPLLIGAARDAALLVLSIARLLPVLDSVAMPPRHYAHALICSVDTTGDHPLQEQVRNRLTFTGEVLRSGVKMEGKCSEEGRSLEV